MGKRKGEVHPHRFRTTYATEFLQRLEGDPEGVIKLMEQMGWSQIGTAMAYLRRDRRKELAQVEKQLAARRAKAKASR